MLYLAHQPSQCPIPVGWSGDKKNEALAVGKSQSPIEITKDTEILGMLGIVNFILLHFAHKILLFFAIRFHAIYHFLHNTVLQYNISTIIASAITIFHGFKTSLLAYDNSGIWTGTDRDTNKHTYISIYIYIHTHTRHDSTM